MKQDRDKCLAAGMDGYLTKPVSPQNLFNAIRGLFPAPARPAGTASAKLPGPDQAKQPEPAPVDLEAALQNVGGDKGILKEVLQAFLEEDSPKLLKNIREGIERQDGKAVKAEAHGMKGASAAMGGKNIAAAAARLEAAALNGDMAAAQTIYTEMCTELQKLQDFYAWIELYAKGGNR